MLAYCKVQLKQEVRRGSLAVLPSTRKHKERAAVRQKQEVTNGDVEPSKPAHSLARFRYEAMSCCNKNFLT